MTPSRRKKTHNDVAGSNHLSQIMSSFYLEEKSEKNPSNVFYKEAPREHHHCQVQPIKVGSRVFIEELKNQHSKSVTTPKSPFAGTANRQTAHTSLMGLSHTIEFMHTQHVVEKCLVCFTLTPIPLRRGSTHVESIGQSCGHVDHGLNPHIEQSRSIN
jgi:hypothetical protein